MPNKLRCITFLFLAFFAIICSCESIIHNTLSLTINTISNDTINDIDVSFCKKSKNDKLIFRHVEGAYFKGVKSSSFNTFNLEQLHKGQYTILVYSTINGARHAIRFDSVEIKHGQNTMNKMVTLRTPTIFDSL